MANPLPDPSWPWITQEPGRVSASPLEAAFPIDHDPAEESPNPPAKRQKLDDELGSRLSSRYSDASEKASSLSRPFSFETPLPKWRKGLFPRDLEHENGTPPVLGPQHSYFPPRPSSERLAKSKQRTLADSGSFRRTLQGNPQVVAELYPWDGKHSEDDLNEHSTRNGFYDEPSSSTSDLNTARPVVWSCLKHRSGLHVLSSLFVATLCQRQSNGTASSTGTFKPPPRVTLTDTKRETWLRDLADPTIPLRRLSRTIPHGIRGKALLDHCLFKAVPSWRAVWLAKCVGANEVRASKRKGPSGAGIAMGELKWIEEWTQNVEQFLDCLLVDCSGHEWRAKLIYAFRLIAHFYSERLLDRRHFIDWVITSLVACKVDRIPIWLLAVRLHWKEIWRFRHCGKHLAKAILHRLSDVRELSEALPFVPLIREITVLLRKSSISFSNSFLLPRLWRENMSNFDAYFSQGVGIKTFVWEQLVNRNIAIARLPKEATLTAKRTPRQNLISILDGLIGSFDVEVISQRCLDAVEDCQMLVNTVLEWSSTPFRLGPGRLYLGVRLLRHWKEEGVEIDQPILHLIGRQAVPPRSQATSICRILIELIRSRHFSASRYLQWLLAREQFSSGYLNDELYRLPALLLSEIPLQGLPDYTLNLRKALLNRLGYSVQDEAKRVAIFRGRLMRVSSNVHGSKGVVPLNFDTLEHLEIKNRSLLAEASHLIHRTIGNQTQYQASTQLSKPQLLSAIEFQSLRQFFEKYEEFSVFADVMKMAVISNDRQLLHEVTSTLNWHYEVFQAIGVTENLFWDIHARVENSISRTVDDLPFLLTLMDLSERMSSPPLVRGFLRHNIELCSPAPPIAACSPVTDPDAGLLEGSDTSFLEEVETLMTSGNSMDNPALSRLFLIITSRVEKEWAYCSQSLRPFFDLLCRLRQFDRDALDKLLTGWLRAVIKTKSRPHLPTIVIPLVCSTTMELPPIMDLVLSSMQKLDDEAYDYELGRQSLSLLMAEPTENNAIVACDTILASQFYRWEVERARFLRTETRVIPVLFRTVLDHKAHLQAHDRCSACGLISNPSFGGFLHTLLFYQPKVKAELEAHLATDLMHNSIDQVLRQLLDLPLHDRVKSGSHASSFCLKRAFPNSSPLEAEQRMKVLISTLDDFNIALSQLNLIILLRQLKVPQAGESYERAMTILVFAAISTDKTQHRLVLDLISVLHHQDALQIHMQASSLLFTSLSCLISGVGNADLNSNAPLEQLLSILDIAEAQIPECEPVAVIRQLCDTILEVRTVLQCKDHKSEDSIQLSALISWTLSNEFHDCINIILRLLTIHYSKLRTPHISESLISRIVTELSIVLVQPVLQTQSALLNSLFDHIALLNDCLTPESRTVCLQTLHETHSIHDPRVEYLLDCPGSPKLTLLRLTSTTFRSYNYSKNHVPSTSSNNETKSAPFYLRRWEMVQDATPTITENDTSLNLSLFGARRALI